MRLERRPQKKHPRPHRLWPRSRNRRRSPSHRRPHRGRPPRRRHLDSQQRPVAQTSPSAGSGAVPPPMNFRKLQIPNSQFPIPNSAKLQATFRGSTTDPLSAGALAKEGVVPVGVPPTESHWPGERDCPGRRVRRPAERPSLSRENMRPRDSWDRGRNEGLNLAPPSKPDRPVSGIRLSSQWVLLRDWIACARAMAKENNPSSAK